MCNVWHKKCLTPRIILDSHLRDFAYITVYEEEKRKAVLYFQVTSVYCKENGVITYNQRAKTDQTTRSLENQ